MTELERQLLALGRGLDHPPVPPLAARVRERLEAQARPAARRAPSLRRPSGRRVLVLAMLGLVLLAATALAASPGARDALLDALGIGGVEVESTPAPPPAVVERRLLLGEQTTLPAARAQLAFRPLLPRSLGAPDRVFVDPAVDGGALSLVYRPAPGLPRTTATGVGLLITEFGGDLLGEYLHKIVPDATTVERLRIGGDRAAWIAGAPHFFFYGNPAGRIASHDLEVAENVLLVDHGRVLVRFEGAFGREAAARIARSLASR